MDPRKLIVVLWTCAATAAAAEEPVVYGPDGAPTVVQRKLHQMTGRLEVGLAGQMALNTPLVNHYGGLVAVTWHPNEWLDYGAELSANAASVSQLGQNIRADLLRTHSPLKDEFANDNQLRGVAMAVGRIAPIYGKLNLASEVRVHFQTYLLGGLGLAAVHRESITLCADPASAMSCSTYAQSDAMPIAGALGAGFRFWIDDRFSIRTEVRSFLFRSSYRKANDLAGGVVGPSHDYLAAIATAVVGVARTF